MDFIEHDYVKLLVDNENMRSGSHGTIVHLYGEDIPVVVVEFHPNSEVMDVDVKYLQLVRRPEVS